MNSKNDRRVDGERPEHRLDALAAILELVDLTALSGVDHSGTVLALCHRALEVRDLSPTGKGIAAVCVWPLYAGEVKRHLAGSGIKTAVVAGGFPTGQMDLALRVEECRRSVEQGADEIDMVIHRGRFISGDHQFIQDEVGAFADVCGRAVSLKVILETGELSSEEMIRHASRLVLDAGADFLKTSTGKITPGATPEAFAFLVDEVVTYHDRYKQFRGIKAAGGIVDAEDALLYYDLVKERAGAEWLRSDLFRFGASRLVDRLVSLITKP
jgi:deoxyribose-phosphate aldolase